MAEDVLTFDEGARTVSRALLVRRLERIQTVMQREPCHEECPAEYEVGDSGVARCNLTDPADYICPGCLVHVAEIDVIRPRLRLARARLRYALDRIIGASDG